MHITPTVGRIVHYRFSRQDADYVNSRRMDANFNTPGSEHALHAGNNTVEGQVLPAVIVRVWDDGSVNLHILLDGTDAYWATSRREGDEPGTWCWPERA